MRYHVLRATLYALLGISMIFALAACSSADVSGNLAKYWAYRQIQRDYFVLVGTGQGRSMPACWRCLPEQQMNWGDGTLDLGWYIGALATEHYMLTNPGLFPGYATGGGDLDTCRNELQYALAALDRLDSTAENALQAGFPDTPGFFIRDDVPDDLHLNFPGMTNTLSDYTNPDWWAKEMSQDQVCHVLMGLTLVKKLIPSDLVVNGMNLRSAAITRGADIVDWVHQHGWIIYDPVFNIPVNRGEDARAYGKGFARAGSYLTDGAEDWGSTVTSFYQWMWDTLNDPGNPAYDNYNNRHMAMVIASSGNGWGDGTLDSLMSLADAYDWYAYPLQYAIVHDTVAQSRPTWAGHQATMNSIVQAQLDLAPASGPHEPTTPEEENTGWCADRKFIRTLDNANHGGATDGYQYPGLDYLVLHNLLYIVSPSLWQNQVPAPGQATNPSPASGATGVSLTPTLSWTAGSDATSRDVNFGNSNPPPFVQNQGGTTYNPGTLAQNTTYYWRIDEKNSAGTTTGNVWSFTTANLPPAPVTNFTATAGNGQVSLSWTNPGSDYAGTMVRYSTVSYPGSQTGGTLVYNGTGTSKVHTGLCNGVTYYYSAFTYDAQQNYSSAATRDATPAGMFCFSDSFSYANGALNGNAEWAGSATAAQIEVTSSMVRLIGDAGSYDAIKPVYCQANGSGYIPISIKIYPGVGDSTMWSVWFDDTSGANLGRWYGSATTARGRIGATADVTATQTLPAATWSTLLVKVNPSANTTQFFFNGADIGTLSHASQGAGDQLGRIRIERVDNSGAAGNSLYFDDAAVGEDTTPPGPVTNFVCTRGDMQNALTWTNPGSDYAGTMIRFSTITYPGSPTGGTQCYNGTGTSTTHTGLTNGVTYYYSAFAYDGTPNYSSIAVASGIPADTTAPGNVTGFAATSGDTQVSLYWTKPGDADLAGIKIMFKTTGYPTGPTDGTQCYNANGTSTIHTGLTNGVTYYYKAFAYDEVPNYASGAQASAVPADVTPPGSVTGFTATPSGTQNALAWTNPGGDFTGTKIMWKTTGYPTGIADGTQCYNSNGTTYAHTGLTPGVTYYYCAYAHDEVPNYAAAAQASGTILTAFCFQDEFNYAEGVALVGQGGWTGTATNAHIKVTSSFVQVYGGATDYYAQKTTNCTGGPYIWVRLLAYQGVGATNMWNVWINDSGGKNFARWYGTGTTARGRIGTSSTVTAVKNLTGSGMWDSLVVKIDPAANTTQFYFNGEDLGAYSHGTQPGSAVGQVKIERENNGGAAGHHMYLDNIRVSSN